MNKIFLQFWSIFDDISKCGVARWPAVFWKSIKNGLWLKIEKKWRKVLQFLGWFWPNPSLYLVFYLRSHGIKSSRHFTQITACRIFSFHFFLIFPFFLSFFLFGKKFRTQSTAIQSSFFIFCKNNRTQDYFDGKLRHFIIFFCAR